MPLTIVNAEYVLPYPSAMPGNKLHTIGRFLDTVKEYWSFGNIAKQRYYRTLSDKYLVQAKTLFEYKQYLLASQSLQTSDNEFKKVSKYLMDAYGENKDISKELETFIEAAQKHIEVLVNEKSTVPDSFEWTPEHESATQLFIGEQILSSIAVRQEAIKHMRLFMYCVMSISADIPLSKKAEACKTEYQSFSLPEDMNNQSEIFLSEEESLLNNQIQEPRL